MRHRHLNHKDYTLAAIDDVIGRGKAKDWAALRRGLLRNPQLGKKILRVCRPRVQDPYAQRYFFWKFYVQKKFA